MQLRRKLIILSKQLRCGDLQPGGQIAGRVILVLEYVIALAGYAAHFSVRQAYGYCVQTAHSLLNTLHES
jgi:hypothetical protein